MLQIKKTNEKNKDFFTEMGYYFSRKEIIKEMDCQLYSNQDMNWFIGYIKKQIIGFISVQEYEKYYYIDNFYVLPEYRGFGYGKELFEKAFRDIIFENKIIRLITSNEYAKKIFEDFGMKQISKNGKYFKMQL